MTRPRQILTTVTNILVISVLCATSLTRIVGATYDEQFFSANDILFYNPEDCTTANSLDALGGVGTAPLNQSIESFVDKYGQMAFDVGKKYGIPYEAILAQGVIESGYGNSGLTRLANNFFGIKASAGWDGETINMQTGEVYGGNAVTVDATFRKYPSEEAGWEGYGKFITSNPRYNKALNYPGDPIQYITEIKAAGYATSPTYIQTVGGVSNAVTAYIAKDGKWQPSSEIAKTNKPEVTPGTDGSPTDGSSASASSTPNCGIASVSGSSAPDGTMSLQNGWSLISNKDYSDTKCADGTTDKGTYAHPTRGFTIRLCQTDLGRVSSMVSQNVANMIAAAKQDGTALTSSGAFRDYNAQKAARIKNGCPDVDISPSTSCRVQTAPAGQSEHEKGLAIDFVVSDSVSNWLKQNASKYGFYNLPSEAWHWSTSGH
ncbi:hypothetical protein COV88_00495 [Candidatus Saccharibacteria bacterium CG11_big_fil_rev_8_21_14_0_20_41_19]|nr:hypothetical protein [Candidatus Saccharibacteria bacterium]OIP85480.1 MAG: hypothetical protein AUK57_04170 [Candidatus Saccharibacteria bacterium CG2_30_41_52]PIQ71261.1 MAG: hypothetical protein COV88_00495 [Candidatus Saccharibacteria bacterium CG11_big_fil_rev_8_21_14_0_20_41_19]PIZ59792.1 MAG: hypothetical protein COY18_02380 [Candidatus Saccharibacteria bacterium CG_4_10_14_0_2_um_filter_41_11]PJE66482.1 MAG: hypothetical protein COU92_00620 [Candidatus Saccharibacteria bacterium CG10